MMATKARRSWITILHKEGKIVKIDDATTAVSLVKR